MANKLRSRLQEQYQEMIEEQNTSNPNFVDEIVAQESSSHPEQTEKRSEPLSDVTFTDSKPKEPEVHYLARSYTLQTETKQKLRIRVRTERTSIKDYINKCLQKFFETQDYSRQKATPEEYKKFQDYEESLGKKEYRGILLTEENVKKLDYWSSFYAIPKSVLMNYILEMFLQ